MRSLIVLAAAAVALAAGQSAAAQTYPSKPIRLVLPVPPGGGSDVIVNLVRQRLNAALGEQLVVDHRGGAGGNIAADIVAKAVPDGYTLLWVNTGIATNSSLYKKLNHDPIRDFTAITQLTSQSYVLLAHPAVPVKSVQELVSASQGRKGGYSYASTGAGSLPHLGMELLKTQGRFEATHIPYKGAGPGLIGLLGGQVDLMLPTMLAGAPFAKSGKLRAIAVSSLQRSQLLPDVPTVAEQGFPGYEVNGWFGMLAPAGTPRSVIMLLNTEIVKVLRHPEVRDRIVADGARTVGSTPEQFGAYVKAETAKWAPIIQQSGATAE